MPKRPRLLLPCQDLTEKKRHVHVMSRCSSGSHAKAMLPCKACHATMSCCTNARMQQTGKGRKACGKGRHIWCLKCQSVF